MLETLNASRYVYLKINKRENPRDIPSLAAYRHSRLGNRQSAGNQIVFSMPE